MPLSNAVYGETDMLSSLIGLAIHGKISVFELLKTYNPIR